MKHNQLRLCIVMLWIGVISAYSQTGHAMKILLKSGENVTYVLANKPEIKFASGIAIFTCKGASVVYNLADIKDFTFMDATAIETLHKDEIRICYLNNKVTISGLSGDETIGVYSIDGKKWVVETVKDGTTTSLLFESLPKGTYIVKVNHHTLKIQKR